MDQILLGHEKRNRVKVSILTSEGERFKAKENQIGWKGYFILMK